jgi:hypothetical protein
VTGMTGKIEFVFNHPKAVCDVCGKNLDLRLVRFKGLFQTWLVCKRCLLDTAELLMMNEGIG